jgi:hypothetical protein
MTIHSTAGAKVYIANAASATIALLTEYEAITTADDWIQIGEIEDLGEWGPEAAELTFTSVADRYVRRRKGGIDSGQFTLICARDATDAGQIAMRAAVEEELPFPFRVTLDDKPTPTGDPTEFYFRGVVLSARNTFGEADNITRTNFVVGIDERVIEVPASA